MKEYKFEFNDGKTIIKVVIKAESQDMARSAVTYLLNSPEKFDFSLVEVSERITTPVADDSLRKRIFQANVVYVDGKTIKDRYKQQEILNYPIFEMFDTLEIESWDEKDRILKLITTNKFKGE
jgi:hypothetical protein